jgi:ubiquitin-like domain-containing CTD phosphatase 1
LKFSFFNFQTSWRWLEIKLTELGLLSHPSYRISFVLDKTTMFALKMEHLNLNHHVKPLSVIWQLLPQHNEHSTIHVDDLGRNFAVRESTNFFAILFLI